MASLLSNSSKRCKQNVAKRTHRYTHVSATDLKRILRHAQQLTFKTREARDKAFFACVKCTSLENPKSMKKIPLPHVSLAFNNEVQADPLNVTIGSKIF